MSGADPQSLAEIDSLLSELDLKPRELVPISRYQGKLGRHAFRADCEDGSIVKVRHLAHAEAARRLCEVREGLEPAFVPVLAHSGAVIVEPWVPGESPSDAEAERHASEAGALLGRLHAVPPPPGVPARKPTAKFRERAESDLRALGGAGWVSANETAELRTKLDLLDPGSFRSAPIHRDYCAENFVVDGDGHLFVIDNEWMMIGAPEFDLGRTHHRWPMSEPARRQFLDGYRVEGGGTTEDWEFWMVVSTLMGARSFHELDQGRLPPLIDLLQGLSRGEAPGLSD